MMGCGDQRGDPEFTNAIEAFFNPGDKSQKPSPAVSEALIRQRFGESIFSGATVRIEPVRPDAAWWIEKRADLIRDGGVGKERGSHSWNRGV